MLKNERTAKLEPNFRPEKYTVISLDGSDMVCQSSETGHIVRRNVQFAKKLSVIHFSLIKNLFQIRNRTYRFQ